MLDVRLGPGTVHIIAPTLTAFHRAVAYANARLDAASEIARLTARCAALSRSREEWAARAMRAEARLEDSERELARERAKTRR